MIGSQETIVGKTVFPFRHIEKRFLWLQILSFVAAGVALHYALLTISGFTPIAYCLAFSVIVGVIAWRRIQCIFQEHLPNIVQGQKRFVALSATIAFGVASPLSMLCLALNYHVDSGPARHVDALVLSVTRPGYRIGWATDMDFEGDTHYLHIRVTDTSSLCAGKRVSLELQKGLLGYEHVVAIKAP